MYFAKNQDNISPYKTMIANIINGSGEGYKKLFSVIVSEAKKLNNSLDFYKVPSLHYHIIVKLAECDDIINLDGDNLSFEDYEMILRILEN